MKLTIALANRSGLGDLMYSQLYVSKYVTSSRLVKHWLCSFAISRVHSFAPSSYVGLCWETKNDNKIVIDMADCRTVAMGHVTYVRNVTNGRARVLLNFNTLRPSSRSILSSISFQFV
jgi:hypothetical protein